MKGEIFMPSIKKESFGKLSDGREASIWTLRNTKGNELKVTDYGARVVSMRFRDKDFKNRFVLKSFDSVSGYESDDAAGVVLVDEDIEGIKFSAQVGSKSASVIYSLSNDNEISITYEATGAEDISTQMVFSADALPEIDFQAFAEGAAKEKISDAKVYNIIDKPAEVEMELGMFGYDPGCPIDYLNAGLKNAANLFSEAANIELIVYATQDKIHAQAVDGGFILKTGGSKSADGKIKSQTVYRLKNRK